MAGKLARVTIPLSRPFRAERRKKLAAENVTSGVLFLPQGDPALRDVSVKPKQPERTAAAFYRGNLSPPASDLMVSHDSWYL
ncbi:unnamed protein product [Nezara viridula]|uniref:Uncharacterized protein n=1 Tax=Nezara viridula TaxID=85310 RepID=A0A9P0MV30_NEZVI|nr:unnamed protein product [Nezara viridula]